MALALNKPWLIYHKTKKSNQTKTIDSKIIFIEKYTEKNLNMYG